MIFLCWVGMELQLECYIIKSVLSEDAVLGGSRDIKVCLSHFLVTGMKHLIATI